MILSCSAQISSRCSLCLTKINVISLVSKRFKIQCTQKPSLQSLATGPSLSHSVAKWKSGSPQRRSQTHRLGVPTMHTNNLTLTTKLAHLKDLVNYLITIIYRVGFTKCTQTPSSPSSAVSSFAISCMDSKSHHFYFPYF